MCFTNFALFQLFEIAICLAAVSEYSPRPGSEDKRSCAAGVVPVFRRTELYEPTIFLWLRLQFWTNVSTSFSYMFSQCFHFSTTKHQLLRMDRCRWCIQ